MCLGLNLGYTPVLVGQWGGGWRRVLPGGEETCSENGGDAIWRISVHKMFSFRYLAFTTRWTPRHIPDKSCFYKFNIKFYFVLSLSRYMYPFQMKKEKKNKSNSEIVCQQFYALFQQKKIWKKGGNENVHLDKILPKIWLYYMYHRILMNDLSCHRAFPHST